MNSRRPPPPPPPSEPEGVLPDDDYSTFDAWAGDFPEDDEDDVADADARDIDDVPPPYKSQNTMSFAAHAVPLPPRPNKQLPLPPRTANKNGISSSTIQLPPRSLPPSALPPRKMVRPPSPDDPSEDYLEPNTASNPNQEDTYLAPQEEEEYEEPLQEEAYEDAEITRGRNTNEEEYEAPLEETYEDTDEIPAQRPSLRSRALPPKPPSSFSRSSVPTQETYSEPSDEQQYEEAGNIICPPRNNLPSRALPPEPPSSFSSSSVPTVKHEQRPLPEPSRNLAPKSTGTGVGRSQPKLVDTLALRQKIGGLRKVTDVFGDASNHLPSTEDDDDDDNGETSEGRIKNIMHKLAKKSSIFKNRKQTNEPSPNPAGHPSRIVPRPPPPSSVTQPDRYSSSSRGSSASDDSSSGSGNFVSPHRLAEPTPPLPKMMPVSPVKPQLHTRAEDEYWFFEIDRNEVDEKLNQVDGMFLVRPSKFGGPSAPYTLCVYHNTRVFNLNIRCRDDKKYALGTPHQREKTFNTVAELIDHHYKHPITLAGKDQGTVLLKQSPIRDDIYDQTA